MRFRGLEGSVNISENVSNKLVAHVYAILEEIKNFRALSSPRDYYPELLLSDPSSDFLPKIKDLSASSETFIVLTLCIWTAF